MYADDYHERLPLEYDLLRIRAKIWPALEPRLGQPIHFVVAWLQAVCESFPERTLLQLVRGDPGLFPPFLEWKEGYYLQVCTAAVSPGGKACLPLSSGLAI